ncbi:protein GLUTAMINE DUMPER 5 [Oryza brachyantha]|nr:protein GLUTAMINE DUMPER 5 [Oryza brachyantha]
MRPMATAAPPPAVSAAVSPWHSPVPYLFGGLAAMLGLITLALLILACSYWKLNNYLGTDHSSSSPAAGNGDDGSKSPATAAPASPALFRDLVAVVMAGENMPTFLAAPIVRQPPSTDHTSAAADGAAGSPENRCNLRGGGEASRAQLS